MLIGPRTSTSLTTESFIVPDRSTKTGTDSASVVNAYDIYKLLDEFNVEQYFNSNLQLFVDKGDQSSAEEEILYTLYIAEGKRHECPRVQIKIAGEEINALVDTGCEMTIMNENLYNKLRHQGLDCLELPTQHINLVSAFNTRSQRIRKQALLEIIIGDTQLEQIVLLSKQLLTDAILGLDFLDDYKAEISFSARSITLRVNERLHSFDFVNGCKPIGNSLEQEVTGQQEEEMEHMPILSPNSPPTTAVWKAGQTHPIDRHHKVARVGKKQSYEDKASMKRQGGEELSGDECMPQYSNYCDDSERFSAKCDDKNLQLGNRVIGSLKRFQEFQENDNIYVLEKEHRLSKTGRLIML